MRLARAVLGLVLAGVSMLAFAGARANFPVTTCDTESCGYAWGTLRDARNAETPQSIWCDIGSGPGGPATLMECRANDAAGRAVRCSASAETHPGIAEAIRSISAASFVYFAWTPGGTRQCLDVLVVNSSEYMDARVSPGGVFNDVNTIINAGFAAGSLSAAARHDNPNEYIRCGSWGGGVITCAAQSAAGEAVSCQTNAQINPLFAAGVRSIDATSYVEFRFDPVTHICTSIRVLKGSFNLP
jgi:hypothetical protein